MSDVSTPPPSVESHAPIPESNWLWRRVFVFALCTMVCIGVWVMVITMVNLAGNNPNLIVGAFVKIIGWLLLLVWFAMTYYIVGTSGEQVVKIIQTAGLFKNGIVSTVTQVAEGSDGSKATAQTTTGPAPVVVPQMPAMPAYAGPDLSSLPQSDAPENPPWH
jgi:hypothetical protein